MPDMLKVKAFRIFVDGYGDVIVFSRQRSKAYWCAVKSYCESFDVKPKLAFRKLRVCRAEMYDNKIQGKTENVCYGEEFIFGN